MSDLDYGGLMDAEEQRLATDTRKNADYGAMMDAQDEGARQRLAGALTQAKATNPEQYAKIVGNAKTIGAPTAAVENAPEAAEQQVILQQADALLKSSPVLARQFQSPDFAKLAHDDTDNLSLVEKIVNGWKRGVLALKQFPGALEIMGTSKGQQTPGSAARAGLRGEDPLGMRFLDDETKAAMADTGRIGPAAVDLAKLESEKRNIPVDPTIAAALNSKSFSDFWYYFSQKPVEFIATVGAESLPASAPGVVAAIPASMAAGPVGAAGAIGTGSLISDYASQVMQYLQQEGVDLSNPEALKAAVANRELMQRVGAQAAAHAMAVATFDAISGGVAGKTLAPTAMKPLAREATNLALQGPTQGTLGALGEAAGSAAAGQPINAGDVMAEFFGEFAGTPAEVLSASAGKIYETMRHADSAARDAAALSQLTELRKASKLAERDPQTFADFVQAAAEEGPVQDIYVDARILTQTLQQSGLDASVLPEKTRTQLGEALSTGGDVQIPLGDYAAHLAATDAGAALLPHLKTTPDAMTQFEAQTFMQSQAETFRAHAEQILAEQTGNAELQQQADQVQQEFFNQLQQANRFTPEVNTAYSALMRNFYVTMAQRLGLSPVEMMQRYPLRIVAEDVANATMNQRAAGSVPFQEVPRGDGRLDFQPIAGGSTEGGHGAFLIQPARYSDGKALVQVPSPDGFKTRAGRLAGVVARNKWTNREKGYVMSPAQAEWFQRLYNGGWDASPISDTLISPEGNTLSQSAKEAGGGQAQGSAGPGLPADEKLQRTVAGGRAKSGWARATRIRGADGKPLALYRGAATALAPEHFELGALGQASGNPSSGIGVWFTVSRAEAETYGHAEGLFLDVRNPKVFNVEDLPSPDSVEAAHNWRESLRAEGYDGIVVTAKHLGGRVHVVAFSPDQVIRPTPKAPNALDQQARGQISFGNDITQGATVALLKNADLSTFVHESGHFYLEVLSHLAAQDTASPELRADMQTVLDWFGVKPDENGKTADGKPAHRTAFQVWRAMSVNERREMHEKFARGFEAYLFEGQAPSIELQGVFARFRAWLINVYQSMKSLNVQLSDEVRGVFGRMLATGEQIRSAEALRAMEPMFRSATEAKATEAEWQSYQELGAGASEEATRLLTKRSLADLKWLHGARSKVIAKLQAEAAERRAAIRKDVEDEVHQVPVYAAQRFLRRGILPEGDKVVGAKLDIDAMKEMYGDGPAAPWRYLPTGEAGLAGKEGLHPDVVAEMFGFTSGDELVRKILAAEPEASVIEGMTDQRMLERHGDLVDERAIAEAADKAVHNEVRARAIAAELRFLERSINVRAPTGQVDSKGRDITVNVLAKAAKAFAEQIIARKKVKDIKPAQYASAEARAAKAALTAKSPVEKATEKRNQLVNNYATRAAQEAVAEVERALRYLRKFENEGTRKALDPDYVEQIDQLLERFDVRRATRADVEKRASLKEWMDAQRELGFEPTIDKALEAEAHRQHYSTMTLEEFRGLVEAVKNIEHLGRLKKKLLTAKDQREFAAVVTELTDSISANAKGTVPERRSSDRGPLVSIGRLFRNFMADHRKFASLAREMDGWKDAGPMWERLVRTMNDAGNAEASKREAATMKLGALFAPILKGDKLGKKAFIPAVNKTFTREERIGIALNMGNEVNAERVMTGEKWTRAQLNAVLDTLTKEEWDFVQGVWDYLDSFRPDIAAKSKRVTGVEPEWVEAQPVTTKHGIYKGGYYPIKYDPLRSSKAEADTAAEVQRQMERGLYVRSQTRRGHLEERVKSTDRPMRYDLGVITTHVDQVIHDLAWHEWLIDANRLLRSSALDGAIRDHYGPEKLRTMKDTLRDIAIGEVGAQTAGDQVLNSLRHGSTVVGLGWRLSTALLQPIGLTQSMSRIGTKWVLKGAAHWFGDAKSLESSFKKIAGKSDFMRLRAKTMQREVSEIRNKVAGKDSKIEASYFYLIHKLQLVADIPTWWGAYEKAMHENGQNEAKAIALADQAVIDAQGAGQIKDLAAVQRGSPAWKLFTNFYSFFSTTYNLSAEAVGRTNFKSVKSLSLLAADLALLYVIPAALSTLVKATLKGDWNDEDKFWRRLISDQLTYLLGTVVVLREAGGAVQAAAGLPGGDYQGPASVRFFASIAKLAKQAEQGEADGAFWKALNETAGTIFHYPAGQINSTLDGLSAIVNGETQNPGVLISGAKH
jgi:hypothetical protein